jgi:hypothetical protein
VTEKQLRRVKRLLKFRPQCKLVLEEGRYSVVVAGVGWLHPLAFLDLIDEVPSEPIDILNRVRENVGIMKLLIAIGFPFRLVFALPMLILCGGTAFFVYLAAYPQELPEYFRACKSALRWIVFSEEFTL